MTKGREWEKTNSLSLVMCRDTKCTISTVSLENIMKRKQELKKGTGDRYFPRPWRGNHELAFSFSERHLVISIKRGNKIPVLWSINSILLWGNCCCSVIQSCLTLCNTIDCRVPGFPVLHYLLGFVQTQVHWGGDAIQPSHPLSPLLLLPSLFPSIKVFSNQSVLLIR